MTRLAPLLRRLSRSCISRSPHQGCLSRRLLWNILYNFKHFSTLIEPQERHETHPLASTYRSARRGARSPPPRAPRPRRRVRSGIRGRTWGSAQATLRDKLYVRVTDVSLFRVWPRSSNMLRQWVVHDSKITYSPEGAVPHSTARKQSHARRPLTL